MDKILGFILVIFTILLAVGVIGSIMDSYGEFEWRTASGTTGTAEYCTTDYGQSHCRTEDGQVIMVESYTKLNKQGGEE